MTLILDGVSGGYGSRTIVRQASCVLEPGEIICLLGANGCGKTTLLKLILRLLRPSSGTIFLGNDDIGKWTQRKLARAMAYVPQSHQAPFAFGVRDVVLMGRVAHLSPFAAPGAKDLEIAEQALSALGALHLADAAYTEISGGERQLVLIARALAQQTRWLILDEPASSLDLGNQVKVLRAVRSLARAGLGVVMTTHVPDHAFLCASRVAVMSEGRIAAIDTPERAITADTLQSAYGIPLRVVDTGAGVKVVAAAL